MGSTEISRFNDSYTINKQDWIITHTNPRMFILTNRYTKEQLESYDFTLNDPSEFQTQHHLFQARFKSQTLVASKYLLVDHRKDMCSSVVRGNIFLERIPIRLSDINEIPYPDILHFYSQCFKGFGLLYSLFGCFDVTEELVGCNCEGRVKVWINSDFEAIYPDINYLNRDETERTMLDKVMGLLDVNSNQAMQPQSICMYVLRQEPKTFMDAYAAVEKYAKTHMCPTPLFSACVVQMFRVNGGEKGQKEAKEERAHSPLNILVQELTPKKPSVVANKEQMNTTRLVTSRIVSPEHRLNPLRVASPNRVIIRNPHYPLPRSPGMPPNRSYRSTTIHPSLQKHSGPGMLSRAYSPIAQALYPTSKKVFNPNPSIRHQTEWRGIHQQNVSKGKEKNVRNQSPPITQFESHRQEIHAKYPSNSSSQKRILSKGNSSRTQPQQRQGEQHYLYHRPSFQAFGQHVEHTKQTPDNNVGKPLFPHSNNEYHSEQTIAGNLYVSSGSPKKHPLQTEPLLPKIPSSGLLEQSTMGTPRHHQLSTITEENTVFSPLTASRYIEIRNFHEAPEFIPPETTTSWSYKQPQTSRMALDEPSGNVYVNIRRAPSQNTEIMHLDSVKASEDSIDSKYDSTSPKGQCFKMLKVGDLAQMVQKESRVLRESRGSRGSRGSKEYLGEENRHFYHKIVESKDVTMSENNYFEEIDSDVRKDILGSKAKTNNNEMKNFDEH